MIESETQRIVISSLFHYTTSRFLLFFEKPRSRNGSRGFTRGRLDGWGLRIYGCCADRVSLVKTKVNFVHCHVERLFSLLSFLSLFLAFRDLSSLRTHPQARAC